MNAADLRNTFGLNTPTFNRLEDLVVNGMIARQAWIRDKIDPRRDYNRECGYPDQPRAEDYQSLYERLGTAARVVNLFPSESWKVQPSIYEDEDTETVTPFEQAWDDLGRSLSGAGHYRSEEGSSIWGYLQRADELSGIGQYGIILLGLDDGLDLSLPVDGVQEVGSLDSPSSNPPAYALNFNAKKVSRKLLYLRCFPEYLSPITRLEGNPRSPRFGMPTSYQVTLIDPSQSDSLIAGATSSTVEVHWTRVIHIADNRESSEVFGTPRMRHVLNHLLDIKKVYSGAPEAFWLGGFAGHSFEIPDGDTEVSDTSIRAAYEKWRHGMQRLMVAAGGRFKSLAPAVTDPRPWIEMLIDAICIALAVPKRIFLGSERGELASSQDAIAWDNRIRRRQSTYLTPFEVCPFVNRLIALGVLPVPNEGYTVWWPDLSASSDADKASISLQKTQAISTYATSGAREFYAPMDFLTRIMGESEEEAEAIIERAEEEAPEMDEVEKTEEPEEAPEDLTRTQGE